MPPISSTIRSDPREDSSKSPRERVRTPVDLRAAARELLDALGTLREQLFERAAHRAVAKQADAKMIRGISHPCRAP